MTASDGSAWDLYREIHKGMRTALFGITVQAGNTEASDAMAVDALRREWRDVCFVLHGHHHHEDTFCDPVVQQYAAPLREALEEGHRRANEALAKLERSAETLANPTQRQVHNFYLDLSTFTTLYLPHLRFEEEEVMPALNRALSDDALAKLNADLRASVPPAEMCVYLKYMMRGMNATERAGLLGGVKLFAPDTIFELFRAASERALPAPEYQKLARQLGLTASV